MMSKMSNSTTSKPRPREIGRVRDDAVDAGTKPLSRSLRYLIQPTKSPIYHFVCMVEATHSTQLGHGTYVLPLR